MKKHTCLLIIFIYVISLPFCLSITTVSADNAGAFYNGMTREAALEYFLNYPFSGMGDLNKINERLRFLPVQNDKTAGLCESPNFLAEINAFTSTVTIIGEELSIVIFPQSNNKALKRLRDEVRLPPPKGGAIVRIYSSKEVMPPPIRALFQGQIQGITRWCRFIAVNAENKSPEEIEDIISHELVHAYISSTLGFNNNRLPRWFNEGVALYLSGAKDQYISPNGLNWLRISRATDEYEEYLLIFRYLDYRLGHRGVANFIREAVQQRSLTNSISQEIGFTNYNELQNKAREWQSKQQNRVAWIWVAVLSIILISCFGVIYRNQLHSKVQTQNQLEQAERAIQFYEQQITAAVKPFTGSNPLKKLNKVGHLENQPIIKKALAMIAKGRSLAKLGQCSEANSLFDEALQIAGWWPEVADSVQQARDELDGIIV